MLKKNRQKIIFKKIKKRFTKNYMIWRAWNNWQLYHRDRLRLHIWSQTSPSCLAFSLLSSRILLLLLTVLPFFFLWFDQKSIKNREILRFKEERKKKRGRIFLKILSVLLIFLKRVFFFFFFETFLRKEFLAECLFFLLFGLNMGLRFRTMDFGKHICVW